MATHRPKYQLPLIHTGPLEVICLGLPRCATSTLKVMLEETLRVGPCMHMSRCLPFPTRMALVERALKEPQDDKRHEMLTQLFAGCAATADFPGHLFVEDLVILYPNAKFVLNTRPGGARSWVESMQQAIAPFKSFKYRLLCWWSLADWQHHQTEMAWDAFVKQKFQVQSMFDEEVYERHNEWVRKTVCGAGKQLLEWEPSDGYAPLCAFIGKECPDGDIIPKMNERGQMQRVLAWRIKMGLKLWTRNVILPSVVAWIIVTVANTAVSKPLLGGLVGVGL
jgi:hypothetical protein